MIISLYIDQRVAMSQADQFSNSYYDFNDYETQFYADENAINDHISRRAAITSVRTGTNTTFFQTIQQSVTLTCESGPMYGDTGSASQLFFNCRKRGNRVYITRVGALPAAINSVAGTSPSIYGTFPAEYRPEHNLTVVLTNNSSIAGQLNHKDILYTLRTDGKLEISTLGKSTVSDAIRAKTALESTQPFLANGSSENVRYFVFSTPSNLI